MTQHIYTFSAIDSRSGGRVTINRSISFDGNDIISKFTFFQEVILDAKNKGFSDLKLISEQVKD